ncbi:MAG: M15 family metallopeptidase [Muribaculaceae bacterium]
MKRIAHALIAFACLLSLVSADIDWASQMESRGLVDVEKMCDSFIIDIRYATSNNFVGKDMYGTFTRVYLHRDAAQSLVEAQKALQKINKAYSIIIYDAARPQSVQRAMWNTVKGTSNERYVARSERGGPHNYGVAVDVGLAYNGKPVDMGTDFDSFSTASHITNESTLVKQGKISKQALHNRQLLRRVMTNSGFMTYRREWWHFERHRISYARAHCRLLDF